LSGRGNTEGSSAGSGPFIGASNLNSTKARLFLMATRMKLGSLPPAKDPVILRRAKPRQRTRRSESIDAFSDVVDVHRRLRTFDALANSPKPRAG
jgi:hypothetical protein